MALLVARHAGLGLRYSIVHTLHQLMSHASVSVSRAELARPTDRERQMPTSWGLWITSIQNFHLGGALLAFGR
jgi:hypothetical protein